MNLRAGARRMLRHLPAIRFLPDGTIDEASPSTVRLSDSTGAALWLVQSRIGWVMKFATQINNGPERTRPASRWPKCWRR